MVRRCHGHSCCGNHFLVPIAIHWECNSRPFERLTPCMHIKVTSSRNLGGPWCWNALFGNIWLSLFLMICWVQVYSFFVPRMCERMWIFVYTKNISSKRNFGTVKAGVSLFFWNYIIVHINPLHQASNRAKSCVGNVVALIYFFVAIAHDFHAAFPVFIWSQPSWSTSRRPHAPLVR